VAYRRGFKSEASDIATEVRAELGLSLYERLDPHALAESLEIPIIRLSDFLPESPAVGHLLDVEPEVFSAVTVFSGTRRTIVHNDAHSSGRQVSDLTHELSHGLLHHPPTPALDNTGCRLWNQDIEDEANWLAGALLIPEAAAMLIAKGRWSDDHAAAQHFGVSQHMVRFRVNVTGARRRVQRSKAR
jgi:Zn-dependent peptidase ImmA (M78 family)